MGHTQSEVRQAEQPPDEQQIIKLLYSANQNISDNSRLSPSELPDDKFKQLLAFKSPFTHENVIHL